MFTLSLHGVHSLSLHSHNPFMFFLMLLNLCSHLLHFHSLALLSSFTLLNIFTRSPRTVLPLSLLPSLTLLNLFTHSPPTVHSPTPRYTRLSDGEHDSFALLVLEACKTLAAIVDPSTCVPGITTENVRLSFLSVACLHTHTPTQTHTQHLTHDPSMNHTTATAHCARVLNPPDPVRAMRVKNSTTCWRMSPTRLARSRVQRTCTHLHWFTGRELCGSVPLRLESRRGVGQHHCSLYCGCRWFAFMRLPLLHTQTCLKLSGVMHDLWLSSLCSNIVVVDSLLACLGSYTYW